MSDFHGIEIELGCPEAEIDRAIEAIEDDGEHEFSYDALRVARYLVGDLREEADRYRARVVELEDDAAYGLIQAAQIARLRRELYDLAVELGRNPEEAPDGHR